jgi:hypothetical protein
MADSAVQDKPETADEPWEDEPGASVEDAADQQAIDAVNATPDGDPVEGTPEPERLPGVSRQLSLIAGGEVPDSSSFKMRGGSIPVEGEFAKGSVVRLEVTVSVDEVTFVDKKDNDGYVVATERRHIAKILGVHRTDQ